MCVCVHLSIYISIYLSIYISIYLYIIIITALCCLFIHCKGTFFPTGNNEISCTAEDFSKNQAVCSFYLFVSDVTPPLIACPVSTSGNTDPGENYFTFNYTALASDNVLASVPLCSPSGNKFLVSVIRVF